MSSVLQENMIFGIFCYPLKCFPNKNLFCKPLPHQTPTPKHHWEDDNCFPFCAILCSTKSQPQIARGQHCPCGLSLHQLKTGSVDSVHPCLQQGFETPKCSPYFYGKRSLTGNQIATFTKLVEQTAPSLVQQQKLQHQNKASMLDKTHRFGTSDRTPQLLGNGHVQR